MERINLLRANYLDILFEGRNKQYGGYELRKGYVHRARRATAAVVFGVAIVSAIPIIADALSTKTVIRQPQTIVTVLTEVPKREAQPPLPNVAPPPPTATISDPVLRVVNDEQADATPPTLEEVQDKQIALATTEGASGNPGIIPTGPTGTGRSVEMPRPAKDTVYKTVEQMPQFPGDIHSYLQSALRYPNAAREAGEQGRAGVQFVVNEDGSISAAEVTNPATPLLDAEALRVVRAMPRWKPGKQNGTAVKVYFTLPVTFRLD